MKKDFTQSFTENREHPRKKQIAAESQSAQRKKEEESNAKYAEKRDEGRNLGALARYWVVCCKTVNLPENPLALTLQVILGAFALGSIYLWIKDRLYVITTGKPASERVRERTERLNAPLTRGQYRFRLVMLATSFVFFVALLFTGKYGFWWKVSPLYWGFRSASGFVFTVQRWRRENAPGTQSSEAAT